MSSTAAVLKFFMEKNSINALHGKLLPAPSFCRLMNCINWQQLLSACSLRGNNLGLSFELGSLAAGVMISTTDLAQHTLEQVEPIQKFFAALFLASIGMLIHVHFLWSHVDILLDLVLLVVVVKIVIISVVVKGLGYNNKNSLLVGMSIAQIGEFAFVLLSRAQIFILLRFVLTRSSALLSFETSLKRFVTSYEKFCFSNSWWYVKSL